MKSFSQTTGADVDTTEFQEGTHWMSIKEAEGQIFVVKGAHSGETKWGLKYFIEVIVENDPEAIIYTISASENSAIYHQIATVIEVDGKDAFPFRATVRKVGRTYEFADAPAKKAPPSRATVERKVSEESPF